MLAGSGQARLGLRVFSQHSFHRLPSTTAIGTWTIKLAPFRQLDTIRCNIERWDIPAEPGAVSPQHMTLKDGCNAIDAGDVLPNINDAFTGKTPEMGAYEFGKPLPQYGPCGEN